MTESNLDLSRFNVKREHDPPKHLHLPLVAAELEALPPSVDLLQRGGFQLSQFPPLDQGSMQSCTGNAFAGAVHYIMLVTNAQQLFAPSRLFIYWWERVIEHKEGKDVGVSYMKHGRDALLGYGVCPEDPPAGTTGLLGEPSWPYLRENELDPPPQECIDFAANHTNFACRHVPRRIDNLRASLNGGWPFVLGIALSQNFWKAADPGAPQEERGVVPMPPEGEDPEHRPGHAILVVGYDDTRKLFKFRNSEGPNWGDAGYGYLHYDFITDPGYAWGSWNVQPGTA